MKPEPSTDNVSVFNEYAKICIEKYGLAEVNHVDLETLADSIRPFINNHLSSKELFDYLSIMTLRMNEAHTSLKSLTDDYYSGIMWFAGYPMANNAYISTQYYYGMNANPQVQFIEDPSSFYKITYGYFSQDKTIGYIYIVNFTMNVSNDEIETMMDYLKDAKGIVIDVRGNIGGYIELASRIASYFTSQKIVIGTDYIKNGPNPSDFAASKMELNPSGYKNTFLKPVIVLHDRVTYSSGSLFVIMMKAIGRTETIGQIFGGGTGQVVDGFLANGWKYTISTSNFENINGQPTSNGINADIPMVINTSDKTSDAIIDKAISELQNIE
jgi:hypothetical protein